MKLSIMINVLTKRVYDDTFLKCFELFVIFGLLLYFYLFLLIIKYTSSICK